MSPFHHLNDRQLSTEIGRMQAELRRRQEPKWTGRMHTWGWDQPFGNPLARSCQKCAVGLIPAGSTADPTDADTMTSLLLREDCPRR